MKKVLTLAFAALLGLSSFHLYNTNTVEKTSYEKLEKEGLNVGDILPDITLKNAKGESIALSSLRGKIVLVDFWASWCGPCRRENPNIVQTYHKYKKANFKEANGFEVYSISFDGLTNRYGKPRQNNAKQEWLKAIKTDKLSWKNHVSDLKGWNSLASEQYQIQSIPNNFLIDQDGRIIAKKLRGPDLSAALDKLLK